MTEEEKKELQEIKEEIKELNKTIKTATNMILDVLCGISQKRVMFYEEK